MWCYSFRPNRVDGENHVVWGNWRGPPQCIIMHPYATFPWRNSRPYDKGLWNPPGSHSKPLIRPAIAKKGGRIRGVMTIADFRPIPEHVGSQPDLTKFNMAPSALFSFRAGPDRVVYDCTHSQVLGTGKALNGSGIAYLAESSFSNDFQTSGSESDALQRKKMHLSVTQPRYS